MAEISNEELAALDQIAWSLTEETYAMREHKISVIDDLLDAKIEHFLVVRDALLNAVKSHTPHKTAGTWGKQA